MLIAWRTSVTFGTVALKSLPVSSLLAGTFWLCPNLFGIFACGEGLGA